MSEPKPESVETPITQDELEDWKVLRDVLEERDREWWAEAEEDGDV